MITQIVYRFCGNDLFEGNTEEVLSQVDIQASINKYAQLVEKVIQERYPEAKVKVKKTNLTPSSYFEVEVFATSNWFDGTGITECEDVVRNIGLEVYQEFDWVVENA